MIALTTKLMKMLRSRRPGGAGKPCHRPGQFSAIFAEFPRVLANKPLTGLICDTLTLIVVSSGTLEVHAVEEVMDHAMKTHFHEMPSQHALTPPMPCPRWGSSPPCWASSRPWDRSTNRPKVLGGMIGSALVGTFLGVFLAYGMVGPLAARLKQVLDADEQIFHAVKQVIIASLNGYPQPLVVESARSGLGHDFRPGLSELLDALRGRQWRRRTRRRHPADHRQEGHRGRGRAPWRGVEGGLCRFRHRDDGLLPDAVAAGRNHRRPAQGAGRLFHPHAGQFPRQQRRFQRLAGRGFDHSM